MRGALFRAVAARNGLHPDVASFLTGTARLHYEMDRRRFLLDYPNEEAPPQLMPLGTGWMGDYWDLYLEDQASNTGGSAPGFASFLEFLAQADES